MSEEPVNAAGEWLGLILGITMCSFEHWGGGLILIANSLLCEAGRRKRLKNEAKNGTI